MSLTSYRAAPPRVNFKHRAPARQRLFVLPRLASRRAGFSIPRDIFLHGADAGLKRMSEPA